jgi:hypothetical protein
MNVEREKFQEALAAYEAANHNYREYVEQFFTHTFNGEVVKENTKSLTSGELEKIKALREEAERLEREFKKILES